MFDALVRNIPYLARGGVMTLALAAIAIVGSNCIGIAIGCLAAEGGRGLRAVIRLYTVAIRGVPVLVIMFLGYYALPTLPIAIQAYAAVVLALIIYAAAFVTEIVRGAIVNVPQGQTEAAKALGLGYVQRLRLVVLPQALRAATAPLINNAVVTVKITAYASIVGAWELAFAAREVVERTLAPFQIFTGVMLAYFAICYALSRLARTLERSRRGTPAGTWSLGN